MGLPGQCWIPTQRRRNREDASWGSATVKEAGSRGWSADSSQGCYAQKKLPKKKKKLPESKGWGPAPRSLLPSFPGKGTEDVL